MRRVQSDPTFNRYSTTTTTTEPPPPKPRPLSRRFVVASMIDLAMPRVAHGSLSVSATIETAIKDVVTEVFDVAPKDSSQEVRRIKANLEK